MNRTSKILALAAPIFLIAAGVASVADARHGGGGHGGGGHGGGGHAGGHHGGGHHNGGGHQGGQRQGFSTNGAWIDGYGYGGSCAYAYGRWMATRSAYWRNRYYACMN